MNIHAERHSRSVALARAHGLSNVIGGGWPLLHRRSFEAVFGAKTDRWLLYTVAGLLVGNGAVQLMAGHSAPERRLARAVGMSTSTCLLTIDLIYASAGRIPRTYLLDALMEAGWLGAWIYDGRH